MKKNLTILLIFLSTVNTAWAEPVVYLEKGSISPFSGFLFDRKRESELRLLDQELTYYKSLSSSLNNINKLQEENITKFDEKIKIRDEKIEDLRKSNNWMTLGSFVLGCLVTTAIVFGVSNVQK